VTVALNGVTHAFPDDIDIILVSPAGQKVVIMSDCGGGHSITNVNLAIDDTAASGLPDSAQIVSGTYKPTDFEPGDNFPPPAPVGPVASTLSAFNGANPNGNWSLYVVDDSAGDAGNISGGWTLAITTISPISPALNLVVGVSAAPEPVFVGSVLTYSLTLTNMGPASATGVILTDLLPPGVTLLSTNSTQGSVALTSGLVNFNVGALAPGAGVGATIRVTAPLAGVITNTVSAASGQTDLDPASNVAQVLTTVVSPLPARLAIAPAANSQFEITVTAQPGQVYAVQGSTDFVSWTPLLTGTASPGGTLKYTTTNAQALRYRFYRAVRIP
jgi:uncharacterized repeat protein (TIGR01451 family)